MSPRTGLESLRAGGPDCPSDLALDRLHAGELPPEQAQMLERHAEGCAACGPRLAERKAGFAGIEGVDPRAMLARIRTGLDERPRPSFTGRIAEGARRLLVPAAALAVAGLAVMVLSPRDVDGPRTRFKGGPVLHVFRLVGERPVEAGSGDAFAPGDRLRFVVDLPSEGDVAVLGVESSGTLYTAWPLDPATPTHLAAGTGVELPGAVALDAQPGRETLYLVHCPSAPGPTGCASAGPGAAPQCPAGCVSTPFVLNKKP
ncbi:zf-HC2 domain-containing protein [Myxococcaceae bacterium GXIMD 01537]